MKMQEVTEVLEKSGYPGMKVLEFAFDGDRKNEHLPYNWIPNMAAYGGTHDNDTLVGVFSRDFNHGNWDISANIWSAGTAPLKIW